MQYTGYTPLWSQIFGTPPPPSRWLNFWKVLPPPLLIREEGGHPSNKWGEGGSNYERCTAKNYLSVSLLSVVSKVFEKFVNNRIVAHLEKCGLSSDFQMVLGLLDQQQIFWQLCLIELLGILTGLGCSSCSSRYIQCFWQSLACWPFSQT